VNWLFIHQNFPAQYVHLAGHLARSGQNVVAITQRSDALLENVRIIHYEPGPRTTQPHDYLREFDASVTNGIAVAEACKSLHREGFMPDMVIGHNGWGELLYVKDVWPRQPCSPISSSSTRPRVRMPTLIQKARSRRTWQ
jgi:hypothetical protein